MLIQNTPYRKVILCPAIREAGEFSYAVSLSTVSSREGNDQQAHCRVELISLSDLQETPSFSLESTVFGSIGIIKLQDGT